MKDTLMKFVMSIFYGMGVMVLILLSMLGFIIGGAMYLMLHFLTRIHCKLSKKQE